TSVVPHAGAWIMLLTGKTVALAYIRSKADRWDYVLRDGVLRDDVLRDDVLRDDIIRDGVLRDDVLRDDVLQDSAAPEPVAGLVVPVKCKSARAYWIMGEAPGEPRTLDSDGGGGGDGGGYNGVVLGDGSGGVALPTFTHGCVLHMEL
ncbi:MAG: hypothetical protein FWH01_14355, partial [Oscillospiraceae bacterium]|nr:hypothetical protein [Oscillospiraceae bacterium]